MSAAPAILPPAFAEGVHRTDPPGLSPKLRALTDAQVDALVAAAPAAAELPAEQRQNLQDKLKRIAGHAAALALEDWQQSEALGQRPVVRTKQTLSRAQNRGEFQNAASSRVGVVTRSTLNAISFPEFVADLIKGTFASIMDATTTQMDAYMKLLEQVSQTVEQFEAENISDAQANQWLAQQYPLHIRLEASDGGPIAVAHDDADGVPEGIQTTLLLPNTVSSIDDITIEETLLPAARRKLAQSRLQMLSSLVMMGLQRIVINHGRIRATMGFHIDASDTASRSDASLLDTSVSASGSFGMGPWSASVSTSVTYVRSTKSDSNAELNVNADLTGEVDLTFSTDYLPLNRMATDERIARIQNNTPNPAANAPSANTMTPRERPSTAGDALDARLANRSDVTAPNLANIHREPARNEAANQSNNASNTESANGAARTETENANASEGANNTTNTENAAATEETAEPAT